MSEILPERVDPQRLAQQGARLAGQVSYERMTRLQAVLSEKDGVASLEVRFSLDDEKRVLITGHITARLSLTCQRCLGLMQSLVETDFFLAAVASDTESTRLPEPYEPLLVDKNDLILADLVTDELLLALPMIPKHESVEKCSGMVLRRFEETKGKAVARQNPFAVLAELKSDRDTD